jgi:Holliday junction resolvase RusA-like endonuclease
MITFTIPGEIKGKQRPRVTRTGHVYTPSQTRQAEADIAKIAKAAMGYKPPMAEPVSLNIMVTTEPPRSITKAKRELMLAGVERPAKKPDLDNVVKLISDALNGIVFEDDRQVVELWVVKRYGEEAKAVVSVDYVAKQSA